MRRFARVKTIADILRAGSLGALLALAALAAPAWAGDRPAVVAARLGQHGETTRFVIELSQKVPLSLFTLANPDRVVIDVPALDWNAGAVAKGKGLVQAWRYGNFRP